MPHVAGGGGEGRLPFLPSVSVPTLGLWSSSKPTSSSLKPLILPSCSATNLSAQSSHLNYCNILSTSSVFPAEA